jgi:hypothetical protein
MLHLQREFCEVAPVVHPKAGQPRLLEYSYRFQERFVCHRTISARKGEHSFALLDKKRVKTAGSGPFTGPAA